MMKSKNRNQYAFSTVGTAILLIIILFAISAYSETEKHRASSVKTNLTEIKNINQETIVPDFWPKISTGIDSNPQLEKKILQILNGMTVEQKVAQMIQPEIRDISVEDMRRYGFGSYLNGGGSFPYNNKQASALDWIRLAEAMYQASVDDSLDGSKIPTMWGTDAVHGHNNVIGATLFPHNIGLGATNNPKLIEQIAAATAKEVMATGIDWVFAPTVAVVRNDRWGRTYEGYSEDPAIVKAYSNAIVTGLQGAVDKDFLGEHRVISTVKHFIGDGGTKNGDDQGDNLANEEALFNLHAQGYVGGLSAGAQTVMASFNRWHGVRSHGNRYLLTQVLKERMGFDGIVVGDWNGHGQIEGCSNESCSKAVNAGLDIYMAPTQSWKPLYENTVAQVKSGEISPVRIDDAVSRILRVKLRAGLFNKPSPANRRLSGKTNLIGTKKHRDIARQAVRESLVLLKNENNLLPLSPNKKFLITGDAADNIGKQSGGWTITWQGTNNKNSDFPGGTSIYQGIKQVVENNGGTIELSTDGSFNAKPDVAIVVFGEEPYAEGNGDLSNLDYQQGNKKDLALLKKLRAANIPVVSIFLSGRPLWVNPELNASNAFVAAWLPGTEGKGIAEVILSRANGDVNFDFKGKLSFSWPATPTQSEVNRFDINYQPLLSYGFGLKYGEQEQLTDRLTESYKLDADSFRPKAIFRGTVKAPWQLFISEDDIQQPVLSSVFENNVLHIRTVDKKIQEDARQVTWNGSGQGSVSLSHSFPEDFRNYLKVKASLSLDIKVDSSVPESFFLGMACQKNCASLLDISSILREVPVGKWKNISIDLACFSNLGSDFGKVFTPLSLATAGKMKLSFGDILIKPNTADDATLSC